MLFAARNLLKFPLNQLSIISATRRLSTESGKVLVNGVNLFYEKAGSSEHAVLCIPGALGSTRSDFGPQLEGLQKDFTVIAFDPRGYGKSIPPERTFPKDVHYRDADDAVELMLNLGYPKFSVLAWSDGGNAGMILAATRPEVVKKIVVWGSYTFVSKEDVSWIKENRAYSKLTPEMKQPLEDLYGKEPFKRMWTGLIERYCAFHDEGGDICRGQMSKIRCPLLVIHGQKDNVTPQEHADFTHKTVPGSKFYLMLRGKHNLHLRYAQEFNELVTRFLKENS